MGRWFTGGYCVPIYHKLFLLFFSLIIIIFIGRIFYYKVFLHLLHLKINYVLFKINFIYYLFIYFWLCWVFITARRLSLVAVSKVYSLLRCAGFSLWWLLLLQSMGSGRAGFSSCGTQAQ